MCGRAWVVIGLWEAELLTGLDEPEELETVDKLPRLLGRLRRRWDRGCLMSMGAGPPRDRLAASLTTSVRQCSGDQGPSFERRPGCCAGCDEMAMGEA